mgnify:FL=1
MNEEHILRQKVQEDIDAGHVKAGELRKQIQQKRKEYEVFRAEKNKEITLMNHEAKRKQKAIDIYFNVYVKYVPKKKRKKAEIAGEAKGDHADSSS